MNKWSFYFHSTDIYGNTNENGVKQMSCLYHVIYVQLEMLLIPNALCWSSRKCNCACALPAEVQLRLRVTRRSWQKLFAGKNFVKILVTAQTQLRSYSEQQRAFGNSNICNCNKLKMVPCSGNSRLYTFLARAGLCLLMRL